MARTTFRFADLRLIAVGLVFVLAWAGIGYKLFRVQGADAATLAQRGFDQRVRHETIQARRGTIYDRDGIELAVTVNGKALVADPSLVEAPGEAAEILAPIIGADYVELVQRLEADGRFTYVARRLESETVERASEAIESADLVGFSFLEEPLRIYPSGALAAPVIGLTRLDDGTGVEGIEAVMETELGGRPGKRVVERDQAGRAIPQAEFLLEPSVAGSDVVLTLDREIQYTAESSLQTGIDRSNALGGSVIVLDIATGEILAMVSLPGFDGSDRSTLDPSTLRNRAITDVYEPGSTLKVVTVAAALEEGVVRPDTPFETPNEIEVGEEIYTDHGYNPPVMTVSDIVARSSNVGTIKIQGQLGNEAHYRYLDAFGLGRPASIDFAGESTGRLDHVTEWYSATAGPSAAIGYGVGATPLQMAALYATLANDGEWVEPHVVSEIIAWDGERTITEPRRHRVVSAETARTVRTMLRGVVEIEGGTGFRAAIDEFPVGGKTGTSNKFIVETGEYSETETIAWFIGIAPIDAPEIVVAVVLDTPRGTTDGGRYDMKFGGTSAAPIFADIAESTLHQLGVSPTHDGDA
ncbi:MAG: penicillin-binding protein 2 [Actinomycetota bacterium]|nr:penicillin-binding protein 2 [Actinomycetota bacterium]